MTLDQDTCYRALCARDCRFDGLFFVAVSTTGVYCRPICPARTPARSRCRFFPHAAQAESAGYRACLRCRPELAPGHAPVDAVGRLAREAWHRINQGYLDHGSTEALARELGVTSRHLRRAVQAELGVSPMQLAQTRRLALANGLLHDTDLPLAQVAFAAGFNSIRRFNAAFRQQFRCAPTALRRGRKPRERMCELRVDYRPPLSWNSMVSFLRPRLVRGLDTLVDQSYQRTLRVAGAAGWIAVTPDPHRCAIRLRVSPELTPHLGAVVSRVRSALDLDGHPATVAQHLGTDPLLHSSVQLAPGLRVPGAFDGFETAARVVLGQQVSVAAAATLAARMLQAYGTPVPNAPEPLARVFPTAEQLAQVNAAQLARIGMPRRRAQALRALARAVADGVVCLQPGADPEHTMAALLALDGVGPWTASAIAMRVLAWPDAFIASDLHIMRALGVKTARQASLRAETWRPWRAYAAVHLWNASGEQHAQG